MWKISVLNCKIGWKFVTICLLGCCLYWLSNTNLSAVEFKLKNDTENINKSVFLSNQSVVILWAGWRSGSKFLGNLLANAKNNTFYSYEPLHSWGVRIYGKNDNHSKDPFDYIQNVTKCRISSNERVFQDLYVKSRQFVRHNPLLRSHQLCQTIRGCPIPDLVDRVCRTADIHVIKIIRLKLEFAEDILQSYPNVKAVYMVRDPRPMMSSRWQQKWCRRPDCRNVYTVCNNEQENLLQANQLARKFKERFTLVRYEDMIENPFVNFKQLWIRLGQVYNEYSEESVKTYIQIPTAMNLRNPKPINITRYALQWRLRQEITYENVKYIERTCNKVFNTAKYYRFKNFNEFVNESVDSYLKYYHRL